MATKTTPLSVRVTDKDAEFIASLDVDGAVTPSDKIRALIKEAKTGRRKAQDLGSCLGLARKALDPLFNRVKEKELQNSTHSDFLTFFGEWQSKLLGYFAMMEQVDSREFDAKAFEAEVADRAFRLMGAMARLGVTSEAPCYDPALMAKGFAPLAEILQLVQERLNKEPSHENQNS